MKNNKIYFGLFATGMALAGFTQSCVSDEPFAADGDGELHLRMVVNSEVTRAENNEDDLRSKCVVYVSKKDKGLLYKYQGLENVPDALKLKAGSYVAEAWTGDSVTASWDKKFYRGYQPFEIEAGSDKSVAINCRIANVVVSVNPATVMPDLMKDWTITVSNSRGSLDFTADNMDEAKAYFMMPDADCVLNEDGTVMQDEDHRSYYTNLRYEIKGKTAEGRDFSKSGLIYSDRTDHHYVQGAHEYRLNLKYDPTYEETGGSFVEIVVDDTETLVESEVTLYSRPSVKGQGFDIDKQILGEQGAFKDQLVKVTAFGGISELHLTSADDVLLGLPAGGIDLFNATETAAGELKAKGLTWDYNFNETRNLATSYITLSAAYLNSIPERSLENGGEYVMTMNVKDKYGKITEQNIRIAVGKGAEVIDDPVSVEPVDQQADLMAVGAYEANLSVTFASADVVNPKIQYRKSGESSWMEQAITLPSNKRTRAGISLSVKLTGLEPGTTYEYRAAADGFESSDIYFLTTEDLFVIPNAGMEDWSKFVDNSKVQMPSADGTKSFWDTGNHGSATMNKNVTQKSNSIFHGGNTSAMLKSQFVGLFSIGKFAAGNLFAGTYDKTDGTDGELTFGQGFNGSHPKSLVVYVNYRPGTVDSNGKNDGYLKQGDKDQGQIYVALTTSKVQVKTKTKQLFNPTGAEVVAYGEHTFEGNFGPDNGMDRIEIPFEYYQKAKTDKPLYIVIVCSASKFGDYFCGGEGSLLYVDDFELVYE